jgi:hypothetical protein
LEDADFVVETLDEAERDVVGRLAVSDDAVPIALDHGRELFVWLQILIAQLLAPRVEEASRIGRVGIIPKLLELLTQQIGDVQAGNRPRDPSAHGELGTARVFAMIRPLTMTGPLRCKGFLRGCGRGWKDLLAAPYV